jgi:ribosomal protein L16 Arg81 hydroxylase
MYEDEILYSRTSDWEEVVTCLDQVVVGEIELVNQVKEVEKWHSLMQEYFKEAPTDISRKNFILGVGFSEEIAIDINRLIEHMRQIPQIRERILDLYETWDILVKNS